MSLYTSAKRGLLSWMWTPAVEQLRFRNRPNLKNPLPPHFKRAKMLRVCEPIYPVEPKVCNRFAESQRYANPIEENPYGVFLAKEMRKDFNSHPMIAIYHTNSYTAHQYLHIRGMLFDNDFDMSLKLRQNPKVIKLALGGTKFESVIPLLSSHSSIGYCKSNDVNKLLKVSKKMTSFILIGVIKDNRLLNKADFEYYANVPSITTLHSQLSQTLNSAGGANLSATLAANTLALSQSLTSHAQSGSNNLGGSVSTPPAPVENEKTDPVAP